MLDFFVTNFQIWILIFARLFGLFVVSPFFSNLIILPQFRVVLAIVLSLVIVPSQVADFPNTPSPDMIEYGFQVVYELLIGLSIGFFIYIIYSTFQMAGQVFSLQIGFGISQFFDPTENIESSLIGQIFNYFGILIFLTLNGHLMIISGIWQSYSAIPVLSYESIIGFSTASVIQLLGDMMVLSIQIGLPVMAVVFLLTVAVGILARFAPQMNIFILGFPIYIMGGLITLMMMGAILVDFGSSFLYHYIYLIFGWFGIG